MYNVIEVLAAIGGGLMGGVYIGYQWANRDWNKALKGLQAKGLITLTDEGAKVAELLKDSGEFK